MTTGLPAEVIAGLAEADRLLVATDFDGVLAPIVADPAAVAALPSSMTALRRLATAADTIVAVVSGRNRDLLATLVAPADGFALVGSHGVEVGPLTLTDRERSDLGELERALADLAGRFPGLHVEAKPVSVAVHFRRLTAGRSEATAAVDRLVVGWPAKIISGKEVVE
ncbi:MAG: trehalose-phosphatase, partial [Acidimicrobiales bacterium]